MSAGTLAPGALLPLARRVTGAPDPLRLHARLTQDGTTPHTLLLESADATTGVGERSLLVVRSALRARCLGREVVVDALSPNGRALLPWLADTLTPMATIRHHGDRLSATFPAHDEALLDEAARGRAPSPLDVLRALHSRVSVTARPADVNHLLAGIFGYDLVDLFEPLPPPASDPVAFPRYDFWMPDQVLVVDHVRNATTVLAVVAGGTDADARYHDAMAGIASLVELIQSGGPPAAAGTAGEGHPEVGKVTVDMDDAEYAALVGQLKPYIHSGDVFQIVPSRSFTVHCPAPLDAYARLRAANPSPYMFYV
ncbi:MAG: chorismate-binding protein, partial [Gemmatimonadales bacterium]